METPLIVVDPARPLPVYEQIRMQLAELILRGILIPGSELPSVRQLARDLNVAPNTVVRAYEEMERGGWIVSSLRRGFRVAAQPPQISDSERMQQLRDAVRTLLLATRRIGATLEEILQEINSQVRE
jgi:GntR family transcriptional regulator